MRKIDQAYDYIKSYIEEKGYPPTIREIGNALQVKSTSTVAYYLRKLEEDNRIVKGCYKNRSIQLMESVQSKLDASDLISLPILGEIKIGSDLVKNNNLSGKLTFNGALFKGYDMFVMQAPNDNMINSGILPNDLIVVSRQNVARNGEVVVAMVDKRPVITRLYKEFNLFKLQPDNRNYSPMYAEKIVILGKVVGVIRNEIK